MKRIIALTIGLAALLLTASAQQRMYLFPDFVDANVRFAGNPRIEKLHLNFDMLSQKILYVQDEVLMEITNMEMIQNLVTEDRRFIIRDGLLCEVKNNDDIQVLVNWRVKKVNIGSKGALGATTQAKVEALRTYEFDTAYTVTDWRKPTEQSAHALEVWKQKSENTYFINMDGTEYKIRYLKDLFKAYPAHAKQLKAYAKANELKMVNAEDAFKMFDYLHSLLKGQS